MNHSHVQPPLIRLAVYLAMLTLSGCWHGPKLSIAKLDPVSDRLAQDVAQKLEAQADQVASVRALLRVRAQKATFVQDVSAVYVYSEPGLSRLSLFATQFNRLVGLLIADAEGLQVLLPDERVLLIGDVSAASMSDALAVPLTPEELAAWLRGTLPHSDRKRAVFLAAEAGELITEQKLPEDRVLRARLQRRSDGSYRVMAIELLSAEDLKPLLYSLIHWAPHRPEYPVSLATELSQENLSLLIDITRMELSDDEIGDEERVKIFAVPELPNVRRLPLSSLEKNNSLLSIR